MSASGGVKVTKDIIAESFGINVGLFLMRLSGEWEECG